MLSYCWIDLSLYKSPSRLFARKSLESALCPLRKMLCSRPLEFRILLLLWLYSSSVPWRRCKTSRDSCRRKISVRLSFLEAYQSSSRYVELERLRAKKPKLSTTNETPTAKAKKAAKKTAQRLEKIAAIEQLIEAHAKAPVASESSLTEPHQILCSLVDYQRTATGSKAEKEAACHPSRLLPRIQAIQRSTCRLLRALADSLPAIVEPSLSPTSFVPTVKELMHWACATAVQMLDACQKQAEKHTSADLVPQIMQAMSSAVNAIAIEVGVDP